MVAVITRLLRELVELVDDPLPALAALAESASQADLALFTDLAELAAWMEQAFGVRDSRAVLRPVAERMRASAAAPDATGTPVVVFAPDDIDLDDYPPEKSGAVVEVVAPRRARAGPAEPVDRSLAMASEEAPSEDALRLFATQGTLWETPRALDDWRQEPVTDTASSEVEQAAERHPTEDTAVPRAATVAELPRAPSGSLLGLHGPPDRDVFEPADRPIVNRDSRDADSTRIEMDPAHAPTLVTPAAATSVVHPPLTHDAAESSAPPGVVLVLTLALGLAIGGAGGYLLGQRSASRAHDQPSVAPPPLEEPRPAVESAPLAPDASNPAPEPRPSPPAVRDAAAAPARTTGELSVRSTPVKAGVVVNNVWRGRTPLTLHGLPLGTHTVRVVERGYAPEIRRVVLDSRVPAATVSIQLARATPERPPAVAAPKPGATTGSLLIQSRPPGARVFVNGNLVGTTPLLLSDLPPGARGVRLEHPGYRVWTTTVEITAGQRQRLAASLEAGSSTTR